MPVVPRPFRALLAAAAVAAAPSLAAAVAPAPVDADALFAADIVPALEIELAPGAADSLRADPRRYARCRLTARFGDTDDEPTVLDDVAVKIKGAAGSFRELDDRPALTLNAAKYRRGRSFHGLGKFHLNNAVQDETFMHELLGAGIARAAGLPAARATHARLVLDGRDFGVVVLKEAFDDGFLGRCFTETDGNLYDGGFCQEIDAGLERDEGKRGEPGADLAALAAACREADPAARRRAVAERLDVESFLTFMALERMSAHWDGYCRSSNNYRVYFDPARGGRAVFLPHGMDQIFGDPEDLLFGPPASLVATAVMDDAEWRAAYHRRVAELLPLFDADARLVPLVDAAAARLRPVLEALGDEAAARHAERMDDLRGRLRARFASLVRQAAAPDPFWPVFDARGVALLGGWTPRAESGNPVLAAPAGAEPAMLSIACGADEPTIASWRSTVALRPGRHVLRGRGRAAALAPTADEKGSGAGLRISGQPRTNRMAGDTDWTPLAFTFEVAAPGTVELVAEVRGLRGGVDFDRDSLHLLRLATRSPEEAAAEARARIEERHGPAAWQGPDWATPLVAAAGVVRCLCSDEPPAAHGRFADLDAVPHPAAGGATILGSVTGAAPVFAVLATVEPDHGESGLPVATATDAEGRFVLDCPGFEAGAGRVRLVACDVDGGAATVSLPYVADEAGEITISAADGPQEPRDGRGHEQ